MTPCDVDLSHPGVASLTSPDSGVVEMQFDQDAWEIATDEPDLTGPDYGSISGKWDGATIRRLVFTSKNE
ncbi:MAG: hypothetical protein R3C03_16405 [Pirellulaceae bacterium]